MLVYKQYTSPTATGCMHNPINYMSDTVLDKCMTNMGDGYVAVTPIKTTNGC